MISDLHALRWKQRVLVINEPSNVESLLGLLCNNAAALDERRLAWFVLHGSRVHSNVPAALSDELARNIRSQLDSGLNEVFLIGLDGGVKASTDQLDLEALYALIDAMPMRRA